MAETYSSRMGAFRSHRRVALVTAGALFASFFAYLPTANASTRRPDLIVTSVGQPPGFRQPGQSLTLRDTVKNAGNQKAGRSVTRYYLSENATKGASDIRLTGERRVGVLRPGKKSAGGAQLTVPSSTPPFLYYLLACADAKKQVREKNERNNCRGSAGRMLVDGPEEPGNPLTVTRTLGPGAVTYEIDKDAGGTLTTTGSDGTQYTLDIPANALIETTEVTMTPIDSIEGSSDPFEFDGGLGGAVELEPHGLRLYQPAALTIVPAAPPVGGTSRLGFAYAEGGEEFHLHPWKFDESTGTITMGLTHFSGMGGGYASEIDLSELPEFIPVMEHPEFRNEHSLGELIAQRENGEIDGEEFADLASHIYITHFYRHIVPALTRALLPDAPESDAFDAFNQCIGWARQGELLDLMEHEHSQLKIKMQTLWEFCGEQFPKIAKQQFDQAHERCSREPPVNPPEQVRIMLRWARLSDLMLGGSHAVLGEDWLDKVMECVEKAPASVNGTVSYHWTEDGCYYGPPPDCGTSHKEQSGTLKISFNLRNPDICCDWDDAGGSYEAQLLEDDAWATEHGGEVCDNTSHAEASNSAPTAPESLLALTFTPAEDDHDAFVNFSDYVEDAQSNRHQRFNCNYPFDTSYTTAAVFFSHECPFREPGGVPRTPGLMGTYNPDNKTIDMTCSDDMTDSDGVEHHIEVTGTLTVTGNL